MQNEEGILAVGTVATESPIDWGARDKDLSCPLCGYNLRGLTDPRCPECGFSFAWQELLDAEKNRHPYLFEYGQKKNIRSFLKTYWNTIRPRRFWTDVTPAQHVRWIRLLIYWLLCNCILGGIWVAIPYVRPLWDESVGVYRFRQNPQLYLGVGRPIPISQADLDGVMPWHHHFWIAVAERVIGTSMYRREFAVAFLWSLILLAIWPWLTLVTLLLFRISMRQANIKIGHVLRVVIYCCDFSLLMMLITTVVQLGYQGFQRVAPLLVVTVITGLIAGFRLTIAFSKYLRVHLPLATVLASQVISFLLAMVVMVWAADLQW